MYTTVILLYRVHRTVQYSATVSTCYVILTNAAEHTHVQDAEKKLTRLLSHPHVSHRVDCGKFWKHPTHTVHTYDTTQ